MSKRELIFILTLSIIILLNLVSGATTCTENWQCSDWSPCLGNQQVRSCIDFNVCGTQLNKPEEQRACGTTCIPNWECDSWQPGVCENVTTQTRTCQDTNFCDTQDSKPAEVRECKIASDFSWLVTFIIIVIAIMIVGTLVLILKKLKTGKTEFQPLTQVSNKNNQKKGDSKKKSNPKNMDETYSNTPEGLDE